VSASERFADAEWLENGAQAAATPLVHWRLRCANQSGWALAGDAGWNACGLIDVPGVAKMAEFDPGPLHEA
jgi:hypothetical protein